MKNKKFILTYNNIPFSGFSLNGSKGIFNLTPVVFSGVMKAKRIKSNLEVSVKSMDDIIGLEEV